MSDARDQGEVRGVVIPTGAADLLLPNAAVAEVIGYQDPMRVPHAPDWLLGMVAWRGCKVPLVSLRQADIESVDGAHGQRTRLVICYTPSGNAALPYVGIRAEGPPRLARLSAQTLVPAQAETGNLFVLHGLIHAERPAFIPDMDAIERVVLEAIQP